MCGAILSRILPTPECATQRPPAQPPMAAPTNITDALCTTHSNDSRNSARGCDRICSIGGPFGSCRLSRARRGGGGSAPNGTPRRRSRFSYSRHRSLQQSGLRETFHSTVTEGSNVTIIRRGFDSRPQARPLPEGSICRKPSSFLPSLVTACCFRLCCRALVASLQQHTVLLLMAKWLPLSQIIFTMGCPASSGSARFFWSI